MPTKTLRAVDILEALESRLVCVPGGRDRDGRPLIIISVPPELDPTTKPKLESLILYLLSIFRYAYFNNIPLTLRFSRQCSNICRRVYSRVKPVSD